MKIAFVFLSLLVATIAIAEDKKIRWACPNCANENPPVTHFLLLRGPIGLVEDFEGTVTQTWDLGSVAPNAEGVYKIFHSFHAGEHQIGLKAANDLGASVVSNLVAFEIEPPPAVPAPVSELRVD